MQIQLQSKYYFGLGAQRYLRFYSAILRGKTFTDAQREKAFSSSDETATINAILENDSSLSICPSEVQPWLKRVLVDETCEGNFGKLHILLFSRVTMS